MKLAGFLFYFCHIQISSALKDEAMGPKFLRIKKREREEEEEEIKCLWSQMHCWGPHLTPLTSFQGLPGAECGYYLVAFQSHMIHEFSVFLKTYCH